VRSTFRRPQWGLLIASAVIAICIVGIGIGFSIAVTGREAQDLPDAIERVDPIRGSVRVPAQSEVFVDLLPGFEGVLVVDGLELETVDLDKLGDRSKPGQQITLPAVTIYEPGNATLTFKPGDGAAIKDFSQGEHIVTVIYWKTLEGRGAASSYTWSFNVY